ncbi:class I SAM-dependent methyltransferase [Ornithinimicrobium flavum]|uniref:class I SAM-dependent methyltransferase n=1 Tax=Ornithinimicrobium flavum TaxID=1288636 RepID=UPI001EE7AFB4|nr:class I SAM-dependent methyltransferase [Ornithinimicrobium flavum]
MSPDALTPAAELMRRLRDGPARTLLDTLPPYDPDEVLRLTSRLRAEGHDTELVAAVLTQSRLRTRAAARLGPLARGLLLTADGLEQATRPAVAARHAARLRAAGVAHVWDLGAGLGLDAVALADAGLAVTAVERDPEVAEAAAANLSAFPRARVVRADVADVPVGPEDGAWLDPARRTPGVADSTGRTRRLFRLDDLSPSWQDVQAVAATAAATGAKLSPGFSASDLPPGAEAEWVSIDGDVVECAVWWGRAVRAPGVSAVVGTSAPDGSSWVTVAPVDDPPPPLAAGAAVMPWLAEPDRAVLAAGLPASLAALVSGQELDPGVGYVAAPEVLDVPWARWYAVEEVLPLHARTVGAWLRARGVGRVTLKKRGVPTRPDRFRADLRLRAGRSAAEATIVLTRVGGTPSALVVRPVGTPGDG